MVEVVQLVLGKQTFDLRQLLVGHIGDDYVLIRRQLEVPLVNLRDLSQRGLEVLLRFVLHAAILDEGSVVVSVILTGDPTEFVHIAREVECASGLKFVPKPLLNFRLEILESHPVNSVLQPGVLTTLEALENTTLQTVEI